VSLEAILRDQGWEPESNICRCGHLGGDHYSWGNRCLICEDDIFSSFSEKELWARAVANLEQAGVRKLGTSVTVSTSVSGETGETAYPTAEEMLAAWRIVRNFSRALFEEVKLHPDRFQDPKAVMNVLWGDMVEARRRIAVATSFMTVAEGDPYHVVWERMCGGDE